MANMAWFAQALQSACAADLDDQNSMAVNTLMGNFFLIFHSSLIVI